MGGNVICLLVFVGGVQTCFPEVAEGSEKTGFDVIPISKVPLEKLQAILPGLGLSSDQTDQHPAFHFAIPSGDVGEVFELLDEHPGP